MKIHADFAIFLFFMFKPQVLSLSEPSVVNKHSFPCNLVCLISFFLQNLSILVHHRKLYLKKDNALQNYLDCNLDSKYSYFNSAYVVVHISCQYFKYACAKCT